MKRTRGPILVSNPTFTSTYTMEQLRADTATINHKAMDRRYLALIRLARIKNGRIWREASCA